MRDARGLPICYICNAPFMVGNVYKRNPPVCSACLDAHRYRTEKEKEAEAKEDFKEREETQPIIETAGPEFEVFRKRGEGWF